jgi:hypothetical protein
MTDDMRAMLITFSLGLQCDCLSLASRRSNTQLDEMTKRYKLGASQRPEVKSILESEADDLKAIFDLPPGQRAEESKEIHRVCNREIEAVLHDQQRAI